MAGSARARSAHHHGHLLQLQAPLARPRGLCALAPPQIVSRSPFYWVSFTGIIGLFYTWSLRARSCTHGWKTGKPSGKPGRQEAQDREALHKWREDREALSVFEGGRGEAPFLRAGARGSSRPASLYPHIQIPPPK